ncbi:hypothetical protein KI387_017259, partial [Taxus chinensis]
TPLSKGCGQDASSHRERKFMLRARCQSKRITISDSSRQEFADGTSCGRRMLSLIACFPVVFIENDVRIFRSNYRSKIHAVEVEEAEKQAIITEIRKVLSKAKAAGLLRLVFHDAGTFDMSKNTGGMNGSIIYELDRPENTGLIRSVKVLEKVKAVLDVTMQVSWADLIALAGAEAVALCGGPTIPISLGRRDTNSPDPDGELPLESLNAAGLKECFQRKGFSTQDLVALSGAHTLGNKGFGNPTSFDNSYFHTLLEKPWLKSSNGNEMGKMVGLPSDRALIEDDECL